MKADGPPTPGKKAQRPVERVETSPWLDPGPSGAHLSLEDFPTFLFARISNVMQRDIAVGYLEAFDLNPPQWRALAALAAYSPVSFSELVKRSMSDKALISRTLQVLTTRGLVEVGPDPAHGRRLVCKIRPEGRMLYETVLPRAREAQADLLMRLEAQERVALHAILTKLRAALGGG